MASMRSDGKRIKRTIVSPWASTYSLLSRIWAAFPSQNTTQWSVATGLISQILVVGSCAEFLPGGTRTDAVPICADLRLFREAAASPLAAEEKSEDAGDEPRHRHRDGLAVFAVLE